jgi:hypothetical protein
MNSWWLEDAVNEEIKGSSKEMHEFIENTIKKISHEALSVKIKKIIKQTGQQKFWNV